jgi:hypothetical protein
MSFQQYLGYAKEKYASTHVAKIPLCHLEKMYRKYGERGLIEWYRKYKASMKVDTIVVTCMVGGMDFDTALDIIKKNRLKIV